MEMLQENPAIDSLYITCGCVVDICRAVRDYRAMAHSGQQPVIICYEKKSVIPTRYRRARQAPVRND